MMESAKKFKIQIAKGFEKGEKEETITELEFLGLDEIEKGSFHSLPKFSKNSKTISYSLIDEIRESLEYLYRRIKGK